jgi:GTP-binding protein HflX
MSHDWNLGSSQNILQKERIETAVMVGLIHGTQTEEKLNEYLDELEFLASTAGASVIKRYTQRLDKPNSRFFIGTGKLQEIKEFIENNDIDIVLFDDDLTGKQVNNLEKELKRKIIDRSTLILDIFAARAQTAQAKTQVELAQMQYLLPRLRGLWTHLERQKGGIGMRGPGEKEIETDRRIIRDKINLLKKQLEKIDKQNYSQRKNRGELIRVALVGYTNAGKSTLMNTLAKAEVFAENKLFATLDTTVRKVVFGAMPFLLSDTVGFIRKLPHHLIESFKSTLDELRESDLLIHVVDLSHPQYKDHIDTVNKTLLSIGIEEKPTLLVMNKIDLYRQINFDELLENEVKNEIEKELIQQIKNTYETETLFISAQSKENLPMLKDKMNELISELYEKRYPFQNKTW